MATYIAVDEDGSEVIFNSKPILVEGSWMYRYNNETYIEMPKGSFRRLIGERPTKDNQPYLLKE